MIDLFLERYEQFTLEELRRIYETKYIQLKKLAEIIDTSLKTNGSNLERFSKRFSETPVRIDREWLMNDLGDMDLEIRCLKWDLEPYKSGARS